jgi:hypothetical protein
MNKTLAGISILHTEEVGEFRAVQSPLIPHDPTTSRGLNSNSAPVAAFSTFVSEPINLGINLVLGRIKESPRLTGNRSATHGNVLGHSGVASGYRQLL